MIFKQINDNYIIKLEKNEKIIETLTGFLKKKKITSGYFFGIGAVSKAEIAHFNLKKKYSYKILNEPLEIISLLGNIATLDKQIIIHAHITLSDSEMNVYGGHLKEVTISATCEIILKKINKNLNRRLDNKINLNLLDL